MPRRGMFDMGDDDMHGDGGYGRGPIEDTDPVGRYVGRAKERKKLREAETKADWSLRVKKQAYHDGFVGGAALMGVVVPIIVAAMYVAYSWFH